MLVKNDRKYYKCSSGCDFEGYNFFSKKIHEHSDFQVQNYFQLNFFIEIAKYQLPEFALP